ncbi:MAG: DUF5946 family protein [Dehalococcoidia bacterium]
MSDICDECGAPVPDGGSCRDNFHALLALEFQLPGGPGTVPHFHAVAAYGLQHPDTMNYTEATLAGLRDALADELDGRATIETIRRRMRFEAEGATRVTRRPGDAIVPWRRGSWLMTIADVLIVDPTANAYTERVAAWARSVRAALNAGD